MTLYEILNFNREILHKLQIIGIKPDDCKYIDLYSEYQCMKDDGDKMTYIVTFLSEKYDVSERKVYDIIKKFGKDCTISAV